MASNEPTYVTLFLTDRSSVTVPATNRVALAIVASIGNDPATLALDAGNGDTTHIVKAHVTRIVIT